MKFIQKIYKNAKMNVQPSDLLTIVTSVLQFQSTKTKQKIEEIIIFTKL